MVLVCHNTMNSAVPYERETVNASEVVPRFELYISTRGYNWCGVIIVSFYFKFCGSELYLKELLSYTYQDNFFVISFPNKPLYAINIFLTCACHVWESDRGLCALKTVTLCSELRKAYSYMSHFDSLVLTTVGSFALQASNTINP